MISSFCAVGDFTTRLAATCSAASDGCTVCDCDATRLARAFTQAGHSISSTEASEIVKTAAEVTSEAKGAGGRGGLSWGVLCVCCAELAARKHEQVHFNTSAHRHRVRRTHSVHGPVSEVSCKYDVFLGGSCNPTSWRKDVVIPCLLKEGITYYNPQVDDWYPELIEIEERAKEEASQLLYVIDDKTRAVASMIEVAEFIGSGRDVLVVVDDIKEEAPSIGGERLSRREVEDLNRGREFVRTITDAGGCLVGATIHKVVTALVDISRWGQCSEEDCRSSPSQSYHQDNHKPLTSLTTTSLRLLQQVYGMYDNERRGHLTPKEAEMALGSLHCDQKIVEAIWKRNLETSDRLLWRISLDMFYVLYAEARYQTLLQAATAEGEGRGGMLSATAGYVRGGLQKLTGLLWPPPALPQPNTPLYCDVYLGGSCGETSWRCDDVIPVLNQHGVTYFNPQVTEWDTSLISVEQTAKDQCSVLLFVIGGDTLSVSSMVEVTYYIGCSRRLVLSLLDIPQPQPPDTHTTVEGMRLSTRAIKDYNRGRTYLTSIARKNKIPLYTNPIDAALCAVYIVKGYELPQNHLEENDISLQGTSV